MEFEHVGSHCSLPSCKQKDFLPFTCDTCHQSFCLAHRSYNAHGCDGALKKDITSLDCPICGKSFKFDKSKDPNEIWEEHYSLYCTRKSANSSAQVERCARPDCRTHLGPSNTLTCSKCLKKVCLSHRMEEEHDCIASRQKLTRPAAPKQVLSSTMKQSTDAQTKPEVSSNPREAFLSRFEAKNPKKPTTPNLSSVNKKPKTDNSMSSTPSVSNSSSRTNTQQSSVSQTFLCPMCSVDCGSLENLSRHVENHLMSEPTTATTTSSSTSGSSSHNNTQTASSSSTGFERCPVCNQHFSDPVELVNHVELVHNGAADPVNRSTTQNESTCTLA